jgi:IcmF-related N-terminal domain
MNTPLGSGGGLSGAMKLVAGVVLGAGIVGALVLLSSSRTALLIAIAGLLLIAAAVGVYALIVRKGERRRAAVMQSSIAGHAAAAPQGISNPARRARLDDLRKNFETGIEKFRQADKDVYSVPWYLVVGEPGSGKTEAVRHCNIGFPAGLHDALQGAGGTVNMNWWFTNHAVLLDTAGRMMFEEVEPGTSSEWQEFLKLLVKARPTCPINGMFLFIPADSLIKDDAEALEKKGSRIAQQLDAIQRTLGVRFPVYVIISKSDLVNGFREFFDEITDPRLQHQILGWTNPSPLDSPFRPEQVEDHLRHVQQRLTRRRLGLMMDPVHTEDAKLRRTDQVDAMYAFPDSLIKLSTRLRRYLEMVFVAGQWSAKPLFLRGIFFTSAMREGSALDQELAEALGVATEQLPEGRVWEKNRSFFLRDMFVDKAFPEQGLVSRASSVNKQLSRWKFAVLGLGFGGLALLGALTTLGYRALDRAIVTPSRFWDDAARIFAAGERTLPSGESYQRPVFVPGDAPNAPPRYLGSDPASQSAIALIAGVNRDNAGLGRFPLELRARAEEAVDVPTIFRPVAAIFGDASNLAQRDRVRAARVLFETSWLRPLVDTARKELTRDSQPGAWSPAATAALAQLLRIERARSAAEPSTQTPDAALAATPALAPLVRYVLADDTAATDAALADVRTFEERTYNWLYSRQGGGERWPSPAFAQSHAESLAGLIDAFIAAAKPAAPAMRTQSSAAATSPQAPPSSSEPAPGPYADLRALLTECERASELERELLEIDLTKDRDQAARAFAERLSVLSPVASRVEQRLAVLAGRSIKQALQDELKTYRLFLRSQHQQLISELEVAPATSGSPASPALAAMRDRLNASLAGLDATSPVVDREIEVAAAMDNLILNPTRSSASGSSGGQSPVLAARIAVYRVIGERLNAPSGAPDSAQPADTSPGSLPAALAAIDARLKADRDGITLAAIDSGTSADPLAAYAQRVRSARDRATEAFNLIAQTERTRAVAAFLSAAPRSAADSAASVRSLAGSAPELAAGNKPAIPMTTWAALAQAGNAGADRQFEARFSPAAAERFLADHLALIELRREPGSKSVAAATGPVPSTPLLPAPDLTEDVAAVRRAAAEYARQFARYWREEAFADLSVTSADWPAVREALSKPAELSASIAELKAVLARAHAAVAPALEPLGVDEASEVKELARLAAAAQQTHAAVSPRLAGFADAWTRLPSSPLDARKSLVSAPPAAIIGTFAVLSGRDDPAADPLSRVVRGLSRRVMAALAEAPGESPFASALASARSLSVKFPVGQRDSGELSPAELSQLASSIDAVRAASTQVPAGASPASDIADAAIQSSLNAIIDQLRPRPDDLRLVDGASTAVQVLADPVAGPLAATITVLPSEADRAGSLAMLYPLARMGAGDLPATERRLVPEPVRASGSSTTPNAAPPIETVTLGQLTVPSVNGVRFTLRSNTPNAPPVVIDEASPWAILALMERFGATPRSDRSEWQLDLRPGPDAPAGVQNQTLRVIVRFNRPLPTMNWLP